MKQLLVLSGKGGTGKTTISRALIELSQAKQYADCDVDAPNLHLLFDEGTKSERAFIGMDKAVIDPNLCSECGLCLRHCRFNAIEHTSSYQVNAFACEGCSVCQKLCPSNAIKMVEDEAGKLIKFTNEHTFSTARLNMGSGNSGKLVTAVKKQLISNDDFVVIDGSPGIGCPVIASITGVDLVLIVAEPTLSGMSDLSRIVETAKIFKNKIVVCVNKYNINEALTRDIEAYCRKEALEFVGKISYSKDVVKLLNDGKHVLSIDHLVGRQIQRVYQNIVEEFGRLS